MELFIAAVDDTDQVNQLGIAIGGRGAFPRDYLQAVANLAGFYRDGNPVVDEVHRGLVVAQPGDDTSPTSVSNLFYGVDRRQRRSLETAVPGEIGVQRLVGPDGIERFVVQLPGTES